MKDWNSPGKRVPPPYYGSQSASTASTARKKTSLIKPKAALIGRDCILVAISSIILTEYQGCVGVDIFISDLPWNQLPWKGRLAHACVTYQEMSESSYVLPGGTWPSIHPPHTGGQPSRAIMNPLDTLENYPKRNPQPQAQLVRALRSRIPSQRYIRSLGCLLPRLYWSNLSQYLKRYQLYY